MKASSARSAFVVGAGILVSRIVGLVRQRAFAHYFGQTAEADAFNVALKIPGAVRNLLGEGTLAASFVPVYSMLLDRDDPRVARLMANTVLGLLMCAVSVLTLAGIVLAPYLTVFFAPGLDPATATLATRLTRVLFPMTGLMVLSGWCLGVQNSHRRFFWSYASAALWSLAQIVLLIGWGSRAASLAELAWWLAWATLAGSVLQIAVQVPEVLRLSGSIRPRLAHRAEGVRPVMRNLVPVTMAVGVVQVSSMVDQQIASLLPEGAITSLVNANLIALLPVALFGISVAASSLPDFSRESGSAAFDALRERLRNAWQRILFYIVPSAVALAAFGDFVNGIVYRSGKFTGEDQRIVHLVLAGYAVGLVSFGSVKLFASAFYALQDYRTPLRASLASLVVSAIAASAVALPLRHTPYAAAGIALGSALGSYTNFAVLTRALRLRLGPLYTPAMWVGTRRIAMATIVGCVVALPLRYVADTARPLLFGPPLLATFGLSYLVAAWYLGSSEAARLLRLSPRSTPAGR